MKISISTPIAAIAVAATTLFGCASSQDSRTNTTVMQGTSMSQTQTMGGDVTTDNTEEISATRNVTIPAPPLSLTNTEDIDDMFESAESTEAYDLLALVRMSDNLSTFVALAEAAELDVILKREGPFTVFAPTNEAFSTLSQTELEYLRNPANKMKLRAMLESHVLPSKVNSLQFNNSTRIQGARGRTIPVTVTTANTIGIGGATIVKPNIEASNGIIHVVDAIIVPTETDAGTQDY
ncbi:fasciclin domain-containing protein [Pontibacter harenae]|uniref:fasciclin domain-containing protein n=1 Tax=Pontibacter harenae TaxID=2894083 RepID=UPI001E578E0A|nr:fasciclin domain-containing protein [Pontibacter harenae]MCC9168510.1 fasciclin domain-containing protein [Pontibacter harenae]